MSDFTKSMLRNGMEVVLRDGVIMAFNKDSFKNKNNGCSYPIEMWDDSLNFKSYALSKSNGNHKDDVIEVYKVSREMIWNRPELKKVVTLSDIKAVFGDNIELKL